MYVTDTQSPRFANDRSRSRPTIAFFAPALGAGLFYEKWHIWASIARVCQARDINLLYVAGGEAKSAPEAVLYDLIASGAVDGIVSWTGVVTPFDSIERAREFLQRYHPLPVVNVGWRVPGVPSLAFDQAQGLRELLAHLIEVHGLRRIAYVARDVEHAGFESQYAGYEEAMMRHGLFDPSLVARQHEGANLNGLDARGLRPGIDYQAVVCNTDTAATTVMAQLRARGVPMPRGCAVTGFHDGQEARVAVPPLTTVRMPWGEAGRQAAELLLDLMAGREVPEFSAIPVEVVIRQSCGCPDARVVQAAASEMAHVLTQPALPRPRPRQAVADDIATAMGAQAEGLEPGWTEALVAAFEADLTAQVRNDEDAHPAFLHQLEVGLRTTAAAGANLNAWHNAISTLRSSFLPELDASTRAVAEDLWQQARVVVGQTATRLEAYRIWRLVEQAQALHEIEAALHVVTDLDTLLRVLSDSLPRLGIPRCYLALYDDPTQLTGPAHLILACNAHGRLPLPAGGVPFLATQLVPPALLASDQPYNLAVESLHFLDEHLGFVLFAADPSEGMGLGTIYEALRSQISSALKSLQLYEEVEEARRQAEAANELKSRFLSVVSHELRTPLTLIVGLCEMTGWEQLRRGTEDPQMLLTTLRQHQEQIYTTAQHLDRLIRDVLDLASSQVGQLKLTRERLDLGGLLREVAAMGRQMAQDKHLAWCTEIPGDLPEVSGDRTRLRQILLNLLSNAAKFTAHGEIALRAAATADTITLAVSDTGLGIPTAEQETIFDEFHQSERTAARGYGGMGLGLAITRRLVELHGGQIGVRSAGKEGQGSTFYFTLPALPPLASEPRSPDVARSQAVLILSEGTNGAGWLRRHLTERGFVAAEVALTDTPDWLNAALAAHPGAIVLDCAPDSDVSWRIVRTVKEHPLLRDIPVLFCSLLDAEAGGAVLAVDYLAKPAGREELAQALARWGVVACADDRLRTILVADDEPGILQLHTAMIEAQIPGCRVLTARDGREALALIRQELPDLALLDLMMPELDGFGVLEAMREGETTRDIPVIVLTAQSLSEREMARLTSGVAAVLGKGLFSSEETLAQVEAVLARDKRLGSDTQRLARRAMAFIHAHYAEEIGRADIARALGVNESHLTHCFDRAVGVPPMVYLSRYRIREARRRLETGNGSITNVALAVGFSSSSYFARVFQREVGVSPRAYQRGARPVDG